MKIKLIENSPFTWYGKVTSELSFSHKFSGLTKRNLNGLRIVGIDIRIFEGRFIHGRLHIKKLGNDRKYYRKLKDGLTLEDIFSKFHNIEIKFKRYWKT